MLQPVLELYKHVAMRHVFSHPDVEQLELQGYRVISGLLKYIALCCNCPVDEFSELVEQGACATNTPVSRLYQTFYRHRLAYVKSHRQAGSPHRSGRC